jgi:hypothetical protein
MTTYFYSQQLLTFYFFYCKHSVLSIKILNVNKTVIVIVIVTKDDI